MSKSKKLSQQSLIENVKKPCQWPICFSPKLSALYEDDYCRLDPEYLTIKKFYFPTTHNRRIRLCSIEGIYFDKQNSSQTSLTLAKWGTCLSPIWWAHDCGRTSFRSNRFFFNVIIEIGEPYMKGFTVRDLETFLYSIRKHVQIETQIVNDYPF